MKVLLVSPRTPDTFWGFRHALPFISRKAGYPPLGILTVAALLPRSWEMKLVDMDVSRLSDSDIEWADYVLLSAMIVHKDSARDVARRCRSLGKKIIAGGPLFTTGHESFPEIPHFLLGEMEEIAGDLVADMEKGDIQPIYQADSRPDLSLSPVPRWDLINLHDYANMSVQFCRGCPFDCEFCDVTVLNGHRPRTKTPEQVVREMEALRSSGWRRSVFLVDDNFLGNKKKVKELLREVIRWRRETNAQMDFLTQASVNLAQEPELLRLMADAGFKKVFVGIKTPDKDNLLACNKLQNTKHDLIESVHTIQAAGMEVMGGFIIGFDGDKPDIFRRQFEFIQKAGIVTAMVGLLNALPETKLYRRLRAEGRLLSESLGTSTEGVCNFETRLNREELIAGYRSLMRKLYEPGAFYQRASVLLRNCGSRGPRVHVGWREVYAFFRSIWQLGILDRGRLQFWRFLGRSLIRHPRAFGHAATIAIYGYHLRSMARSL